MGNHLESPCLGALCLRASCSSVKGNPNFVGTWAVQADELSLQGSTFTGPKDESGSFKISSTSNPYLFQVQSSLSNLPDLGVANPVICNEVVQYYQLWILGNSGVVDSAGLPYLRESILTPTEFDCHGNPLRLVLTSFAFLQGASAASNAFKVATATWKRTS